MSWIRTVAEDQADAELGQLFDQGRDADSGRVDAILSIHGLHPAGLGAHLQLYRTVMAGTPGLRKVDRELIAFVVSQHNGCHY